MIVMIIVLEKTTDPQLNNILQSLERCELAIRVRQRAAYKIINYIPANKWNCVRARLTQEWCKREFIHNNNAGNLLLLNELTVQ